MLDKYKLCYACKRLFLGRKDAKTCSPKCRKAYSRAVKATTQ